MKDADESYYDFATNLRDVEVVHDAEADPFEDPSTSSSLHGSKFLASLGPVSNPPKLSRKRASSHTRPLQHPSCCVKVPRGKRLSFVHAS